MTLLKSAFAKRALVAAVAAGSLVASAGVASAYTVCNGAGECWHAHNRLAYPATAGIVIHNDAWGYRHRDGYQWRHDRFDRGYYRSGVWVGF